jgi:hypothetical protein
MVQTGRVNGHKNNNIWSPLSQKNNMFYSHSYFAKLSFVSNTLITMEEPHENNYFLVGFQISKDIFGAILCDYSPNPHT